MFLQKYRYQLPQRNIPIINLSLSKSKRIEASMRISAAQLKSHENKVNYSDPRKFLIENTQKVIHYTRQTKSIMKNYQAKDNRDANHRESFIRQKYDLSKRQERIRAAKKYRERIWKSSDIASLIRAQEELIESRRTQNFRRPSFELTEKVSPYRERDILKEFGDQSSATEKDKLKNEWMTAVFTTKPLEKTHANARNPELQVTNIEFMESEQLSRNPQKVLINRQRRKEVNRRASHISYSSHGKRPSTTTNNVNKFEDNFIEPW